MKRALISSAVVILGVIGLQAPSASAAGTNFYAGKTINLLIGGDAGGGYDLYARLLAHFLPSHIPGKPLIVPSNKPGAGSANAAAELYASLPHDGTAIGALFPGAVVGPLLEDRFKRHYDPIKFGYLASADSSTRVCITMAGSKVKTYQDALEQSLTIGGTSPGASTTDYPYMHIRATGAKFKLVNGYKGTVDIFLAMERKEVDGGCGIDWSSLKSQRPEWVKDKRINILVQDGLKPDSELAKMGVPQTQQFIRKESDKAAVDLIVGQQIFARPYVVPPGTPHAEVDILRKAFAESLADPALLAQAKSERLGLVPISGEEVQSVVSELYGSTPESVARAKELIAP